jgi:TRAP-type C4-dicarboxylate transport system substrate-binding protein
MERLATIKMIALGALALILLIPSANGAEQVFVIKMATLAPQGSSWMNTLSAINEEVMKKTDNRVQFKIYPGGVLGDEEDMLRKMHIGQIQSAALTTAGLSDLFDETDVFQIPFLFQTYDEIDYILQKMDSFFRKGFEDNGYVLVGWSEVGFVYLMSDTPILSVSDLKKVKVWIWENSPMAKAIFDEAEVAAIPLSVPDVLVGLQTGLVDAVYAPPTGAIALQWFTKVKYLTDVPAIYLMGGIVIRKDVFIQMPHAYQDTIKGTFQSHLKQFKPVIRNQNKEAIEVMAKHGVSVITPTSDQIDEFKKLSDKATQLLGNQTFSRDVFDEVSFHLKEYRGSEK